MKIDIYQKSTELLERLANSIHDRQQKKLDPFYFTIEEIHIVEKWLKEVLRMEKAEGF